MRLLTIIALAIFAIGFSVLTPDKAYAQCVCWPEGIEAELPPADQRIISCERDVEGSLILTAESLVDPECPETISLAAQSDVCERDMDNCVASGGIGGGNPDGSCLRQLEDFCAENISRSVPTMSEWGMLATAAALGLLGFIYVKRRKATA